MVNGLRHSVLWVVLLGLVCSVSSVQALNIVSSYSPRNSERPRRKRTDYIVLHTTEAAAKGSLAKIKANGEAHYFVDNYGKVSRVIEKHRVAFHAGRSMWNGKTDIDNYAIGIEVAGYHNKDISSSQYRALRELVRELQKAYRIPDEKVLTHSMVAYGAPNRWHRRSHRGRKRCGMLFARRTVREKLGLTSQPLYDPDVKARRLVNADPFLAKVLYGSARERKSALPHFGGSSANVISSGRSAWDIARDKYRSSDTIYVYPDGRRFKGNEIRDWRKVPVGTKVLMDGQRDNEFEGVKVVGSDGNMAQEIAGDGYNSSSTIYILPTRKIKAGNEFADSEWKKLPSATRILVGYVQGGKVSVKRTAYDICGKRWNFPSTYYMYPDGVIKAGDMIDERGMPTGTYVFYRK
jgi:N-acetyl-anhydromuramyl-L-alanine amidase AmpD